MTVDRHIAAPSPGSAEMKGLQVQPTASIRNEVPDRQPGDTNIVRWGFDLHPQVSFIAGGLLILQGLAADNPEIKRQREERRKKRSAGA